MKEAPAIEMLQRIGGAIIAHDDALILRAYKSEVGLDSEWKDVVPRKFRDGKPVVVSYLIPNRDPKKIEHLSKADYSKLPPEEKWKWKPQIARELKIGDRVYLEMKNNLLDLRIFDLYDDLSSRYRMALDSTIELEARGVLDYRPTAETDTMRNLTEAMRQRLKRKVWIAEYEHNLIFIGQLGRAIHADLMRAEGKQIERVATTVYLKGYRTKDPRIKLFWYDIGHRDQRTPGEWFKLETRLYRPIFYEQGIGIEGMLTQPEIQQERIRDQLTKQIGGAIRLLSPATIELLAGELNMSTVGLPTDRRHTAIAREMLSPERTLTQRVAALEREQEQIKRRLSAIERDRERERDRQRR